MCLDTGGIILQDSRQLTIKEEEKKGQEARAQQITDAKLELQKEVDMLHADLLRRVMHASPA